MKKTIALMIGLIMIAACSSMMNQSKADNEILRDVSYRLSLSFDATQKSFVGEEIIVFQADTNQPLPEIVFHPGTVVTAMKLNGSDLIWETAPEGTQAFHRFNLPQDKVEKGTNHLHIRFQEPFVTKNTGLYRYIDSKDGSVYIYSRHNLNDSYRFFPVFEAQDLEATYSLNVVAPENWYVISSMREKIVSLPNRGRKIWVFSLSPLKDSSQFGLVTGPFRQWHNEQDGVNLRYYTRRSLTNKINIKEWEHLTLEGFDFFESYFGDSYPVKKFDQVVLPTVTGGDLLFTGTVIYNEETFIAASKRGIQQMGLVMLNLARSWQNVSGSWFDKIVQDDTKTMMSKLNIKTEGITAAVEDDLKPSYSLSFFTKLESLSGKKDSDFVERVTVGMIPAQCTQESLDRLNRFLTNYPNLPVGIKETLMVARDTDAECVKRR